MKSDYLPLPVFLLLLSPTAIAWADKPAQLQDRIPAEGTTPSGHVTWYTDDDPASLDYFPAAKAQEVHDAHELAHARFILYGFNAPHYSAFPKELHIYDSADGGSAPHDSITLDAPSKKDRPEPRNRSTMPHELFHHVRYRYINLNQWPSWGTWTIEETARMMEDKTFADLDTSPAHSQ